MPLPLWSVTLTLAGDPADVAEVRAGLDRLLAQSPFLSTVRYSDHRAELRYWDEAEGADDAAAMALRLWPEHRETAGLPDWCVVGVEVVDRDTVEHRAAQRARGPWRPARRSRGAQALDLIGDIAPW
ncbi:hypothetical protein F1544_19165 [Kineosporiaceae bacterium B12]|nr:hypothetical protein [Kineococcus rubinsiae]